MSDPLPRPLSPAPASRWARLQAWKPWLLGLAVVLLVLLVSEALRGFWHELHYDAVVAAIRGVSSERLLLAVLATAVSFVALSGYDLSSLRYVGARVPYRVVAQTSFIAYALSNTIGLGVFTGGAVRMRLYGAAGVDAGAVSRAIAFNALAFGIGVSVIGAFGLIVDADAVAPLVHLPTAVVQTIGGSCLVAALLLLLACRGREIALPRRLRLRLPTAGIAWQQLLFSAVDVCAAAAVLWLLLPDGAIGFAAFVGFFAAATVIGVISHVPGGLGVFEAVMLVALGGQVPAETLAGALVLYRIIYYLLPLLLALLLLISHEVGRGIGAPLSRATASLAPRLLAAFTLVVAVVLLVSGVTPATREATTLLASHVPLPLVEISHFLSSIAGIALLFVARGMLQRLDAAWWAGLLLAGASLLLALPKGIAIWEAVMLATLVGALAVSHGQFTRRASLFAVPFSGGWLLAMGVIVIVVTGLLFFSYRQVDYAQQLWWQFEFNGHAPRSLRALVGIALVALMLALRQVLRPPAAELPFPDAAALTRASDIVRAQDNADAGLALTGDKHLMFSPAGTAFVMYGRKRRSWIALFDPVGPAGEWQELVWQFIERSRDAGARSCFYQVRPTSLPLYLDAGLQLSKLGEYAYVPLTGFTLSGKRRGNLRTSVNRAEREGLVFELVEAADVAPLLDELRAVSDAWLARHRAAEKRFSVGAFQDEYLLRHPVAVVRQDSRIIAFATILVTDRGQEASVDLMRHGDMPNGTMDVLFAKLMLHFSAQGYARFGLGMAPLSGMAGHPLASNWHRVGRLLYAHGENFYHFRGLRAFKEKFDPVWEARYLASPGGVAPLLVLADVAALISGGYRGVISK